MESTSATLLKRLRSPEDSEAWGRFVQIYTPPLYQWARNFGLSPTDAGDLVQDVLTLLLQKLPELEYDRSKSFRSWLYVVTKNRCRELLRRKPPTSPANDQLLQELEDTDQAVGIEESEFRKFVLRRALEVMQSDFQETTWRSFWEHVVRGRPVPEVAEELGVSVKSVYLSKACVLRRLRHELEGML